MRRIANPPKRTPKRTPPKRAETNRNGSQNGQKQPETTGTGSIRHPKLGIPSPAVPDSTLREVLEYLPQSTLTHSARHVPAFRSSHLRCPPLRLRSPFCPYVPSRCSIGYVPSDLQSDGAKYEDLQSEKLIPILYAINAKTRSSGKQRGTYSSRVTDPYIYTRRIPNPPKREMVLNMRISNPENTASYFINRQRKNTQRQTKRNLFFPGHRPLYLYMADSEIRQNEDAKRRNEPRELFFVKSPAAHCQDARTHPSKLLRLSRRNRPAFSVGSFFLLATAPLHRFHLIPSHSIPFSAPSDLKSIVPNIKICSLPEQKPSNFH